jgi:hypothetical protein
MERANLETNFAAGNVDHEAAESMETFNVFNNFMARKIHIRTR